MSSPKRSRRVWRTAAGIAVGSLATLELTAFLSLVGAGVYPEASFREMYASSVCLQASQYNYGQQANPGLYDATRVMLKKVPHPFFGFTLNPQHFHPDQRGAVVSADYENELRYRKILGVESAPGPFTIGVFGASVAEAFAAHIIDHDAFRERLRTGLPFLRDREIVIRNMAIGSSRQPTQMALATFYMELLDLTINLDGFSELSVVQYPDYPIEFPMFADAFYPIDDPGRYLHAHAGAEVCSLISEIPKRVPGLAYSNTYYLIWYNVSQRMSALLYGSSKRATSSRRYPFDEAQVRELYARYYERYTRYQHQVTAANGVHPYFFLQPNQYVAGSKKTFSEYERAHALNHGEGAEIGARYARFRARIPTLRASGVAAFDLTMMFADVEETIYADSCCHVNDRGNELIAARIADTIVEEELRRPAAR